MDITTYRRTKIVATLGPASNTPEKIRELILAGVNVFRLNFSHGSHEVHGNNVKLIRSISDDLVKPVAILADLQGPKIRCGKVIDGGIQLVEGEELVITSRELLGEGSIVSTGYKALPEDVKPGDRILLDDGLLELSVNEVKDGTDIHTTIVVGGVLTSNKGINLPNVALKTPALTDKDEADLRFIMTQDVDFVALSFVRKAEDLEHVHRIMDEAGGRVKVISKIEKPEAIVPDVIDAIIEKSDGLMVARGDLGVEIPQERVPVVQKDLIERCTKASKPVIVATQMMDSMIRNPRPTRAEVSDVANAVLDGATAVMLSGESAAGKYPVESVTTMAEILSSVEGSAQETATLRRYIGTFETKDDVQAICETTVRSARNMGAKLIVTLTSSGRTAREISRYRCYLPTLAIVNDNKKTLQDLQLCWGAATVPVKLEWDKECIANIDDIIDGLDFLNEGDLIVITAGLPLDKHTPTNMMKIHRVTKNKGGKILS